MNKIPYEERVAVYLEALSTFGPDMQLEIALEELSELQKEVCKAIRGDVRPGSIAEEVADVAIMLEQIRCIFSIGEAADKIMDAKIVRLQHRIEKSKMSQGTVREALWWM